MPPMLASRLRWPRRPPDAAGLSVFFHDTDATVCHAHSAYARGVDTLNTAYDYLDLVPKARGEAGHAHPQFWVRRRNEYERRARRSIGAPGGSCAASPGSRLSRGSTSSRVRTSAARCRRWSRPAAR